MTSADFLQFVVTTFFSVCKTSSGKCNHLRLVYLLYLRFEIRAVLDFALFGKLVRFKYALYTVSVRQTEVLPAETLSCPRIRLPSDSTSRWTPLSSANSSYCQVCSGLSPPSDCACRAHQKKTSPQRMILHGEAYFNPRQAPFLFPLRFRGRRKAWASRLFYVFFCQRNFG